MHSRTTLITTLILTAIIISASLASVTFVPPSEPKKEMHVAALKLAPQKAAPKASGMAMLATDVSMSKFVLSGEVNGLAPNKAYEVQLMPGPKTVASFKTDGKGHGKFSSNVADPRKSQKLQIVQLAAGKSPVVALAGNPRQFK